ncbi:hypothetical protein Tco_1546491 [Tanacetum coccineum]
MPPRMTTRSAGRATAAPRGGRTGRRTGRGGGRTRGRSGDQGNGGIDCQGGQVCGQGNEVNDGVDGVPDFSTLVAQQLQNLLPTILAQVGNQGSRQGNDRNQNNVAINENIQGDIEKMESAQYMSGCGDNQKVKYTAGLFVDFKTLTREEFYPVNEMQKLETEFWNHAIVELAMLRILIGSMSWLDEAIRNGSLKKNPKKRRNSRDPYRDRNTRDENKKTST